MRGGSPIAFCLSVLRLNPSCGRDRPNSQGKGSPLILHLPALIRVERRPARRSWPTALECPPPWLRWGHIGGSAAAVGQIPATASPCPFPRPRPADRNRQNERARTQAQERAGQMPRSKAGATVKERGGRIAFGCTRLAHSGSRADASAQPRYSAAGSAAFSAGAAALAASSAGAAALAASSAAGAASAAGSGRLEPCAFR